MRASVLERWSDKVQQHRSRRFLDAAMAAAALVSSADSDVRLSEQLAIDSLLGRMDKLQLFDPHAGVELHRRYAERIKAEHNRGRRDALDSVAKFRGDEEQSLLILYVGAVVAKADGHLSEQEESALADICETLALPAEESLARIWAGR